MGKLLNFSQDDINNIEEKRQLQVKGRETKTKGILSLFGI
jgi:hypothetical protein